MRRAGVFRLNPDTRKWDNNGAGSVFSVEFCEGSDYNLSFYVINNDNYKTILFHRFSPAYDYVYGRGGERIISWLDPKFSTKLALSFRESTDCSFIWDRICAAQKRNLQLKNVENGTHPPSESLETSKTSQANVCREEAAPSKPDTLPPESIILELVPGGPGSGTGRGNGPSERAFLLLQISKFEEDGSSVGF
ncbi:hypothetical protein MRB53_005838 [Persea americana]|uniref:Uncharacterized protein n=1 Tax=Persea americana TaxID=3435 RepID=A0ACC2MF75_PERAE|nr:hypothetical protein MRB53_005838 [Persea americana]